MLNNINKLAGAKRAAALVQFLGVSFAFLAFHSVLHAASPVRRLLNENRLDEAIPICRQFEVLSTVDADNFIACSWVYLRTDRVEGADRFIAKIKKAAVSNTELQLLLAYQDLKSKRYDNARTAINKALEENRSNSWGPVAQEMSAELYESVGQSDTAAFIYKQVVAEDANRPRAQWGLGRYYLSRGDIGRAKMHMQKTAELWPYHIGSRYNLAILLLQNNEINEAAKLLGQCYKINKADVGVLEQLGIVLEKRGNGGEAVKFWRKALSINPETTLAKEKLGSYGMHAVDALVDSGQYEQALAQLNSLGPKMAVDPQFMLRKGIILRYLQKCEAAVPVLDKYVRVAAKDSVGHRELGICYINTKKWDKALQQFSEALEIDPSNGLNHAWVAYVFEVKKKWIQARTHWSEAVKLFTDDADLSRARRRLAAVEAKVGKDRNISEESARPERDEDPQQNPPSRGMWETNPQ